MRPEAMAGPIERNFEPANVAAASGPFDGGVCAGAAKGHIIDNARTTRRIDIGISFGLTKSHLRQASGPSIVVDLRAMMPPLSQGLILRRRGIVPSAAGFGFGNLAPGQFCAGALLLDD
jgi:hypothetical protein